MNSTRSWASFARAAPPAQARASTIPPAAASSARFIVLTVDQCVEWRPEGVHGEVRRLEGSVIFLPHSLEALVRGGMRREILAKRCGRRPILVADLHQHLC